MTKRPRLLVSRASLVSPVSASSVALPEDGVPSKTKVMVANLPYDLKEDKVRVEHTVFIARVIGTDRAAAPRKSSSRLLSHPGQDRSPPHPPLHGQEACRLAVSPARAVVSVSSPLALRSSSRRLAAEMNGKEIEGREIAVKVAIDSPGKEDDHIDAEGEAGAEGSTAEAADKAAEAPAATTAA